MNYIFKLSCYLNYVMNVSCVSPDLKHRQLKLFKNGGKICWVVPALLIRMEALSACVGLREQLVNALVEFVGLLDGSFPYRSL